MSTRKQKLSVGDAVLFAVLLVAGSYFGSRWIHSPDVESVPEHLLTAEPHSVSINRPVHAAVFQDILSVSETDLMSEEEEVHETVREFVQTAPFGAKTNSLNEESQTVRVS